MSLHDDNHSCGGRPSLFTEERAQRIIEAVRRGLTYKQAAAYGGISYATLNRWRIRGRDENSGPEEFREFWRQLEQANGEAAFQFLGSISTAAEEGDWKAASWFLERRFPDQWGRNPGVQIDPAEPLFPG